MDVFITVDVETYTGDYWKDVLGYGKGLPYLLELLKKFDIGATFFVEALGCTRWGVKPLKNICSLIMAFGQDIQLHIHPKLALIKGVKTDGDRLWAYDGATQTKFIETGLRILFDCGVTDVTAFRAGDLAANEDTLAAMENTGLFLSSNRDLDLKSSIHSKLNDSFPIRNDLSKHGGILDIPVTAFRSALPFIDGPYRHFEICALGAGEMTTALSQMVKVGYRSATVLLHPQELFRTVGNEAKPIIKNRRRLESLLDFLGNHPDFNVISMSACSSNAVLPKRSPPDVKLFFPYSMLRVLEQIVDRISTKVSLSNTGSF